MDGLFPELPSAPDGTLDLAALAALSDDEIQEHLDASMAAKDKIRDQDPEFLGDLGAQEILEAMRAGVAGILALKAEQASRVEAQSNLAAELAALDATVTPDAALSADDGDDDSDAAGDDGDDADADAGDAADTDAATDSAVDDAVPEPVLASAPPPRLRRLPAAGRHVPIPANQRETGMTLRASAELGGFRPGEVIDSEEKLTAAITAAVNTGVSTPPGFSHKVVVARGDLKDEGGFPEFRRIRVTDDEQGKIKTLVAAAKEYGITNDEEALVASGGICAPVTPYYQLANVSTVQRPVRDSLVGFIADRGGLNYAPPPVLSDVTTAVGVITADQDAAGGSNGTKSCQTVICPDFIEVKAESIFHCVTAGNLGARAFPEQIAQFNALVLADHARVADGRLLDGMKATSTNVTGLANPNKLGAVAAFVADLMASAAGVRSRNRMLPMSRLQAWVPEWLPDLFVSDIISSQFQRFEFTQASIAAYLSTLGIDVTFYLDGPADGTGQVFGAQAPGALLAFPDETQWAIAPAASFLFLDSGALELGIVRDSVLNATNSYQIFGETWENMAAVGVEKLWVTSTLCPSGTVGAPKDNSTYCD